MEFPETASVGRLSARRSSRQRKATSKGFADSPSQPSRFKKSKEKKKRASSATQYFKVRDVLEERVRNGQLQYCIDWEDNPETGESYTPTWEPRHHLTEQALLDWEEKKRRQNRIQERGPFIPGPSPHSEAGSDLKRRRSSSELSSDFSEAPGEKRQRVVSPEIPVASPVSQGTAEEARYPSEIKDSYEEAHKSRAKSTDILIELPIPDNFDRDAYARFASSSQTSTHTQSQSQLLSSLQTPNTPPAHLEGGSYIVPDSQDQRGPESYVLSQTGISGTDQPSQLEGGAVSESQPSAVENTRSGLVLSPTKINELEQESTETVKDAGYEPIQSDTETRNNIERAFLAIVKDSPVTNGTGQLKSIVRSPIQPPSDVRSTDRFSIEPERLASTNPTEVVTPQSVVSDKGPETPFCGAQPDTTNTQDKTPIESPISRIESSWSEPEANQSPSTNLQPSHQPESYEFSSLNFATQVPYSKLPSDCPQAIEGQVTPRSQQGQTPEVQSQISYLDPVEIASTLHQSEAEVAAPPNLGSSLRSEALSSLRVETESIEHLSSQGNQSDVSGTVPESSREETWQAAQVTSPLHQESRSGIDSPPTAEKLNNIQVTSPLVPTHFTSQDSIAKLPSSTEVSHLESPLISESQEAIGYSLTCQHRPLHLESHTGDVGKGDSNQVQSNTPTIPSPKEVSNVPDQEAASYLTDIRHSEFVLPSIEVPTFLSVEPSSVSLRDNYNILSGRPLDIPDPRMDDIMSDESPRDGPSMSITEMIKQARASGVAAAAASRSASTIPPTVQVPHEATVSQLLSTREALPSSPVIEEAALPSRPPSPEVDNSLLPLVAPNEYIVPLPMVAMVRDVYRAKISQNREDITTFINNEEVELNLLEKMDKMIDDLQKIADHQDLINEGNSSQLNEPQVAKWAETISTKCLFLRELLDAMSSFDDHIAVFARPGHMVDILGAIFKANHYLYYRPDLPIAFTPTPKGRLRITLIPTMDSGPKYSISSASIIIAFDETFEKEQYMNILQSSGRDRSKPVRLISLIVTNSPEHFELCIPKTLENLERRTLLVNGVTEKRKVIGHLEASYPQPHEAAQSVAAFLMGNADVEWPLPSLPQIEDVQLYPEGSIPPEQREQLPEPLTQSYNPPQTAHPPASFKRSGSLNSMEIESAKRQRLISPLLNQRPTSLEPSLLSQTTTKETAPDSNSIMDDAKEIIAEGKSLDEEQSSQVSVLLEKVAALQHQLEVREASERRLQEQNLSLEARLKGHENMIRKIQPKYQEALNERGQAQHDKEAAVARCNTIQGRLDARNAEIVRLKEERQNMEKEVASSRDALLNSKETAIAENGKMREQIRTLEEENTRLQTHLKNLQNDFEFMRENYQQASHKAAESSREVTNLQEVIEKLKAKASENIIEIAKIQHGYEISQLKQRADELERVRVELQRELDKKVEELRVRMNGRRETRGTSVPRSPRMGAGTMSPRPVTRVIGQSSRANSPVSAGWDPVRGDGQRDNWVHGGPVTARWPTHLQ
ncbi:hypothetical protein F5884DRAFT_801173 [Xylogone sp. PMI_703]|nr:hypothetical protein F5884DRAFT_801173 [Xylogone sp. PMI_703]